MGIMGVPEDAFGTVLALGGERLNTVAVPIPARCKILHNTFDGTTLVAILLLWASKPCHPGMFNITVTEMA